MCDQQGLWGENAFHEEGAEQLLGNPIHSPSRELMTGLGAMNGAGGHPFSLGKGHTAACFIAVFPLCCSISTYPHPYTGWAPGSESIPYAPILSHILSSWKLCPEPTPGAQSYADELFLA